jgi:hypothetical protein
VGGSSSNGFAPLFLWVLFVGAVSIGLFWVLGFRVYIGFYFRSYCGFFTGVYFLCTLWHLAFFIYTSLLIKNK